MKEIMKGIDVSHWQGDFDWSAAKNEGYSFAVIKGGGGDGGLYTDSAFRRNYESAKALGIPVGAYFYCGAKTVRRAREEADYFADNVLDGRQFELPVYADIEDGGMLALGPRALTDIALTFCSRLEERGYFVGIYSSLSYFSSRMYDDELKRFTHWVAQWADRCTYPDENCLGIWQNSSSETVAGVRCDTDIMFVDFPEKMKELGKNGFTAHTHRWHYVADTVNHCLECSECGKRKDVQKHTLEHMHDATHHFDRCTVCDAMVNWERHRGGTATDTERAICEVCGTRYGKTLKPIPGDLNGDSELDTRDVVAEMKAVADGSTNQKYDINGDGDVDTKDLVNLVKKVSKG